MKKKIKKFAEGGLNIRDREALNLKNREALNLKNRAALNVDKTSATRDVPFMNKTTTRVAPNTFSGRNGFNQNMVTQKGYDSATPAYEEYYRRRSRAGGPEKLPINTPNVDRRFYTVDKKLIGYDAVKNVPGVRQETYETPRKRLNLNSYDSLQLKKGGAVKGKKCRMDGIAVRGKTRAKERSK
jgi:hypothetical protein